MYVIELTLLTKLMFIIGNNDNRLKVELEHKKYKMSTNEQSKQIFTPQTLTNVVCEIFNFCNKFACTTCTTVSAHEDLQRCLSSLLENVIDDNLDCDLIGSFQLTYAQILALYIKYFTGYDIELSTIIDDDKMYVQIDEKNNLFYFSFFDDSLEFAFGSFDLCKSVDWLDLNSQDDNSSELLQELNASADLINAFCQTKQVINKLNDFMQQSDRNRAIDI